MHGSRQVIRIDRVALLVIVEALGQLAQLALVSQAIRLADKRLAGDKLARLRLELVARRVRARGFAQLFLERGFAGERYRGDIFARLNGWADMKKIEKRFHGIPSLTSEQCVRAIHARGRHPRGVGGRMLRRGSQMEGTSERLTRGVVD